MVEWGGLGLIQRYGWDGVRWSGVDTEIWVGWSGVDTEIWVG